MIVRVDDGGLRSRADWETGYYTDGRSSLTLGWKWAESVWEYSAFHICTAGTGRCVRLVGHLRDEARDEGLSQRDLSFLDRIKHNAWHCIPRTGG